MSLDARLMETCTAPTNSTFSNLSSETHVSEY